MAEFIDYRFPLSVYTLSIKTFYTMMWLVVHRDLFYPIVTTAAIIFFFL